MAPKPKPKPKPKAKPADKVIKSNEKRTLPNGTIQEGKIVQKADGKKEFIVGKTTPPPKKATPGKPTPGKPDPTTKTLYKNSDAYKSLTDSEKKLAGLTFDTFESGNPDDFDKLTNSLKQTIAIADPYYK